MSVLTDVLNVVRTELTLFRHSDRGTLLMHGFIVLTWGAMMAFRGMEGNTMTDALWWIFFSIVITTNYATTIFIAERLSGSWEILLTCGISRSALLLGKLTFMLLLAAVWGYACLGIATLGSLFFPDTIRPLPLLQQQMNMGLYLAASFMNVAFGAWMSVRLTNPRLFPFLSMIILSVLVAVYWACVVQFGATLWYLLPVFILLGGVFTLLAWRLFHSERIVRPMVL